MSEAEIGVGAASERIAAHLREAILSGELAPGQWIRQEEVAARLGASRLPVREALRMLEAAATRAEGEGLVARWGRKVLELRPPLDANKGTAVTRLLGERGLERALYAGDDTTDLDAFRGLREASLETAVRVAIAADEGPAELRSEADMVVDGPTGLLALLREL